MTKILKEYNQLLDIYTNMVSNLENDKKELEIKMHIPWIPYMVLNNRMFTYDEHLMNQYHGGFCYKEKNEVMPYLINFFASYENATEDERKEFEDAKPKNERQSQLDVVIKGKIPFIPLLESQLMELKKNEASQKAPRRPSRSNATRQMNTYIAENEEYEAKIESIKQCRNEVTARIEAYRKLLS